MNWKANLVSERMVITYKIRAILANTFKRWIISIFLIMNVVKFIREF